MNIVAFLASIFKPASELGKTYIEGKQKLKVAQVEATQKQFEAKIKQYEREGDRTHDWEMESLRQAQYSWKDELWTIIYALILLYPILMGGLSVFFPEIPLAAALAASWDAYTKMPMFFQFVIPAFSLASIGIRYKGKMDTAKAIKEVVSKDK